MRGSCHWGSWGSSGRNYFLSENVKETSTIVDHVRYDKKVKEPCQNRHGGIVLENRVEKLRKERGLNQEDFAKAIRVSRNDSQLYRKRQVQSVT